jgi:hypothetical protein
VDISLSSTPKEAKGLLLVVSQCDKSSFVTVAHGSAEATALVHVPGFEARSRRYTRRHRRSIATAPDIENLHARRTAVVCCVMAEFHMHPNRVQRRRP